MNAFRLPAPTIANKLFVLTVNALVGILIITGFLLYTERGVILQERQNGVQQAVETVYGTLEYYQARVAANEMPLKEAQQRAMSAIRGMRYGNGEYFWINDMKPTMLMHPFKPELDNTSLAENKDPDGKRIFVEMVDLVKKNGGGFEFYMWPKPGSDAPVAKVSYVKGYAPWGWVVGSGVYIDSVDTAVWSRTRMALLIAAVLGAALFAVGLLIARSVTRPIGHALKVAQRVAQGDLTSDIRPRSRDETGQLMQALRDMNGNLVNIVGSVHRSAGTIATASSEIASGNLDLSSRTEQQAGSLEETASAMEELTATVRQNADNARQANQLAVAASDRGRAWRQRDGESGRHHGRDRPLVEEDRRHHQRHRRHCVPDQHPGAECRRGSGPRRRAGQGIRRGGVRGAQPGAAQRRGRQGNQGPDRRLGRQCRGRQRAGRPGRRHDDATSSTACSG